MAVLMGMGVVHLMAMNWFLWWCIFSAALGLFAYMGVQASRRAARKAAIKATAVQAPSAVWSPLEKSAWEDVQQIAAEVEHRPPSSLEEVQGLAWRVVKTVAHRLHPDSEFSSARFTLPDVLLAVQWIIGDLRTQVLRRVPGSDVIRVSELLAARQYFDKFESVGQAVHLAYRAYRLILDPMQAVVQEVTGGLQGKGFGSSWTFVKGQIARSVVEDIARSAIDLYGGRLRVDTPELVSSIQASAPQVLDALPVRVAVLGQTNAGKSSLVNAILGEVKAAVSELPTAGDFVEYRLHTQGKPDLVLIDAKGLDGDARTDEAVIRAAMESDLVLWVVSATNPARRLDQDALQALQQRFDSQPSRKSPPILLVVTQVDRLSPQREWAPPYNVERPTGGKAQSIRSAIDVISSDLPQARGVVVPVALRKSEAVYNLDALWVAMNLVLDDARHTALDRALKSLPSFSLSQVSTQCVEGGRFVGRLVLDGLKRQQR